ncbi:MAG: glutamine--fructose-6-phosphate transaminase (isomerizing) [Nitrososphaeria archaeon]
MCGIVALILKEGQASPILHEAIKRLEYRGYDSAGIATLYDGKIFVKKDAGKIDEIHARLNFDSMPGNVGVSHTRWSTHGAPTKENAHPHLDCKGNVAVVHNGVIENFLELKDELIERGHRFVSRTDTEVVPHLVEEGLDAGLSLYDATVNALRRLKGSYALAIISTKEPDKVVCARNESPLVLGLSDYGTFCASDIPAILPYTNKVIVLNNGEVALLEADKVTVKRISDGVTVSRDAKVIEWSIEQAEKQGYPHFMLKEIHEQPTSLRNALRLQEQYLDLIATFLDRSEKIFLLAAGTSHYACIAASYMFSKLARLAACPVISSEFIENYGDSVGIDTVILAVSQSGETYDTLKAVDYARMKAATILGITNVVGSTLTRVSRAYIVQQSGPEIGVAATKSYTAQLLVLAQIALKLAKIRGKLSQDEIDELKASLNRIPDVVENILETCEEKVKEIAIKYSKEKLFLFLGRGISTATALEGRLKLLEISYTPSLAYPAGESKHGPISVVEDGVPTIFICPNDETRKEILGNIMEMKSRGAKIISICEEGDQKIKNLSDDVVEIPKQIHPILSPIPYIIPLQLLAYYIAVEKGLDPDKPRNLAKSVTVP